MSTVSPQSTHEIWKSITLHQFYLTSAFHGKSCTLEVTKRGRYWRSEGRRVLFEECVCRFSSNSDALWYHKAIGQQFLSTYQ